MGLNAYLPTFQFRGTGAMPGSTDLAKSRASLSNMLYAPQSLPEQMLMCVFLRHASSCRPRTIGSGPSSYDGIGFLRSRKVSDRQASNYPGSQGQNRSCHFGVSSSSCGCVHSFVPSESSCCMLACWTNSSGTETAASAAGQRMRNAAPGMVPFTARGRLGMAHTATTTADNASH